VLAIGGLVVIMGFVATALAHNISYLNSRLMIINLLRTNPRQAEQVCLRTPKTYYEAIGNTLKTSAMMQTTDLAQIQAASRPTFDAGCMMVAEYWKAIMMKAKMAAAAGGAALVIGATKGWPPLIVIVCAVLNGGCFIYLFLRQQDTDRSLMRAKAEVLPEIERVFVEGRYR
jgi:hypothetical protein